MDRYLIESPHTVEDCDRAVKEIHAAGYLHSFEWGCDVGVHSAWAIVEAESLEHARQIVPWMFRDKARVVKLVKYEIADEIHHEKSSQHSYVLIGNPPFRFYLLSGFEIIRGGENYAPMNDSGAQWQVAEYKR